MLDNTLIEKALALTGKTIDSMYDRNYEYFSIEKFSYYLLSPEFIEEFMKISYTKSIIDIAIAIRDYQSGDETPLIELLEKI